MTMLTVNDFDKKVLVEYKRNKKGNPIGVVVAIGADQLGWSLCNKKDTFSKAYGMNIALRRAISVKDSTIAYRIKTYEKCPFTLEEQFERVLNRSLLYFK